MDLDAGSLRQAENRIVLKGVLVHPSRAYGDLLAERRGEPLENGALHLGPSAIRVDDDAGIDRRDYPVHPDSSLEHADHAPIVMAAVRRKAWGVACKQVHSKAKRIGLRQVSQLIEEGLGHEDVGGVLDRAPLPAGDP